MSYKAEVIADRSGKWCGNALRFATREEAERYADNLFMRWLSVSNTRVVETAEPPNYTLTVDRNATLIAPLKDQPCTP